MADSEFDDIQIPAVYIRGDWTTDDLETLDDCEDAHILLIAMCAAIEHQIDDLTAIDDRSGRIGRAKAALKWKKLALALVNAKRAKIRRQIEIERETSRDKLVLTYIGSEKPELIREADTWAQAVLKRKKLSADAA